MRKKVIVNGIVRWVGESNYPLGHKDMPKKPKNYKVASPSVKEMFGKFLAEWKGETFTQADIIVYIGKRRDTASRLMSTKNYAQFSYKKNRKSRRHYNTDQVRKLYNEAD